MAKLLEYKCPCCNGKIEFDSSSQQMKCPYCDASFDPNALKEYDMELSEKADEKMEWEETFKNTVDEEEADGINVYLCESCGGEIVGDDNLAATKCPYCDSPVIIKKQFSGELKPDYIIPFKLDKKAAKSALYKHFNGKKLLPKVFKNENHIDEIVGMYVPYWLFDCNSKADINYKATNIHIWRDSKYEYTRTTVYNVYRSGEVGFENIPVDGSEKIPNEMTESIEPFLWDAAVDFQTAYLSGYIADKYDVSAEDSIIYANERVKKSTENEFAKTVNGYTTVIPERTNIHINNGKVKYALLPIWFLNTTWNGKKFFFIMNGQTGKFAGDLPTDKGLYAKWFIIMSIIFASVIYGAVWLLRLFGVI